MRQGGRLVRLIGIVLAPLAACVPQALPAAVRPATTQVIGDSLSCPKAADGTVQVCARGMTLADIINLHAYAGCLVRNHHVGAAEAVRAYVADRSREALRTLVSEDRRCKPDGATRVSAVLLAGALAERLPGWQRRLRDGFGAVSMDGNLIHCLIAADPRGTLAMLRASPLSPGEQEASARLAAMMPACVPAGVRLETHRPALRSMLALVLFDPAAAMRSESMRGIGETRPAAATAAVLATGMTATLTPVVSINAPREQVKFIPRITGHHRTPDIKHDFFEEDFAGTGSPAWGIDPDTGDAPEEPAADQMPVNPF